MQQETVIKLIKLSLKNYEETNDVEHLKDIKRIIDARLRKQKKPATGTCWLDNNIFVSIITQKRKEQ